MSSWPGSGTLTATVCPVCEPRDTRSTEIPKRDGGKSDMEDHEQSMTESRERYCVRPAGVSGCFVLWDRRSNSAVYGVRRSSKNAAEACAQRLNDIYRQFVKD